MLGLHQILKTFQNRMVLDNINCTVEPGEILAVVGEHHSGKSTLLQIIAQIIPSDHGEVTFNNEMLTHSSKSKIGYLPQHRMLYHKAEVLEFLYYVASLQGLSKHTAEIEAIRFLDRFDLIPHTKTKIERLNFHDLHKLELITALIHNPDIIILDEPFKGLDIKNQMTLKSLLYTMKSLGKIVVITSHQLDFLQEIADGVLVLNKGKQILYGAMREVLHSHTDNAIYVEYIDKRNMTRVLEEFPEIYGFKRTNNETAIYLEEGVSKQELLTKLSEIFDIQRFEVAKPSLKDVVLKMSEDPNPIGEAG